MRKLTANRNEILQKLMETVDHLGASKRISLDLQDLLKLSKPKDKDKPTVYISDKAEKKMHALVQTIDKEIAWHGTVTREGNKFTIHDIFVYPQTVTGATVESDDELYPLWLNELEDDIFNSIRMQGHSHVNMGVSPSATDTEFFEKLIGHISDYYIFIIQNKSSKIWINIYDKTNNILYEQGDIKIVTKDIAYADWANNQITEYISVPTVKYGKAQTIHLDDYGWGAGIPAQYYRGGKY